MHFGKEDGSTAALLKISSFFGRVTRQEGILGHISATPLRHAFFQNALWLDVFIPCVFGIAVDSISVCLKLGIACACGVFWDWRGVNFWRRSCPCQPKPQMIEDISDHWLILNKADDPHRPLTFWADKGINLVYLLNQSGPAFLESLFVSLRFENAGDDVIQTFLLAFSPRDVAVVSVISHHLLAPVRDVRTHRALKSDVLDTVAGNLKEQQKTFDLYRYDYNHERPHESLHDQTPGDYYKKSNRPYVNHPHKPEYDHNYMVRNVRHSGEIKFMGKMFLITNLLVGQPVRLKEIDDGLWQLQFSFYVLGSIDLRINKVIRN